MNPTEIAIRQILKTQGIMKTEWSNRKTMPVVYELVRQGVCTKDVNFDTGIVTLRATIAKACQS